MVKAAPTPKDIVHREGTARLYRFRRADDRPAEAGLPLLLVPSVINRWYVLDLRAGASVAEALVNAGFNVYCLDWGAPEDEDRFLEWDDFQRRIGRMVRTVLRDSGASKLGLLGYCIGGTLTSIYAAQHPEQVAALVNLAGPIDFSHAGFLGEMTDPRWFDPDAIASAGNMSALQMQSGFIALRPTSQLSKVVSLLDKALDPEAREAFQALDGWASDNIAFPAAAYATYITELYQQNTLVAGKHRVLGAPVDLGAITCPVLTVGTDRDNICPLPAATALNDRTSGPSKETFVISGGHVGAVVGAKASRTLYPKLVSWFGEHLRASAKVSAPPPAVPPASSGSGGLARTKPKSAPPPA
jgi:polyhydroxyalkanoate synthase